MILTKLAATRNFWRQKEKETPSFNVIAKQVLAMT